MASRIILITGKHFSPSAEAATDIEQAQTLASVSLQRK